MRAQSGIIVFAFLLCLFFQFSNAQLLTVSPSSGLQGQRTWVNYIPACNSNPASCQNYITYLELAPPGSSCGGPQFQSMCSQFTPPGSPCILQKSSCTSSSCAMSYYTKETGVGTYNYCGYVFNGGTYVESSSNTFTILQGTNGNPPFGTMSVNPQSVIPGGSANVTTYAYSLPQNPNGFGGGGILWIYNTTPVLGARPVCPAHAETAPTCGTQQPGQACLEPGSAVFTSCGSGGGWVDYGCFSQHYISEAESAATGNFGYCAYYYPGAGIPSTYINFVDFNSIPVAPAYGLNFGFNPTATQPGQVTTASLSAGGGYVNWDGGSGFSTGTTSGICSTGKSFLGFGSNPNERCIIEYAGPYPKAGCVAPIQQNLPNCESPVNGTTGSGGGSITNPPCILNTISNSGPNVGGSAYNQFLSTTYLPTGNYLLCGYNYAEWDPYPPIVSKNFIVPDFATGELLCNKGVCTGIGSTSGGGSGGGQIVIIGGGVGTAPFSLSPLQGAICLIYGLVNSVFIVLALILMLTGGAMYGGANVMPGAMKGQTQGYAQGLLLVGVISAIISVIALYSLSLAAGTTITGCTLPPAQKFS